MFTAFSRNGLPAGDRPSTHDISDRVTPVTTAERTKPFHLRLIANAQRFAAAYFSASSAGMRPRSGTASPWLRAHSRMRAASPEPLLRRRRRPPERPFGDDAPRPP